MIVVERNTLSKLDELTEWASKADTGDTCTYHIGAYLADTSSSIRLGLMMYELASDGKVYLFQRKLGPFNFEYIAVRSHRMKREHIPIRRGKDGI